MRKSRTPSAFTLVELLVVIAIIVLLVAILIPSLGRARQLANRAKCLATMRGIGHGLYVYATANDGWMPSTINEVYDFGDPSLIGAPSFDGSPIATDNFLRDALGDSAHILVCPNVSAVYDTDPTPGLGHAPTPLSDTTYQANGAALGRTISSVPMPASFIMLDETTTRSNLAYCRPYLSRPGDFFGIDYYQSWPNRVSFQMWHKFAGGLEMFANVHDGGSNIIYFDGHGEYQKYRDLRSANFGLVPDEAWSPTNSQFPDAGGNSLVSPYLPAF